MDTQAARAATRWNLATVFSKQEQPAPDATRLKLARLGPLTILSEHLTSEPKEKLPSVSKGNKLLDLDEPYLLEYDSAGGITSFRTGE